MKNLLTLLALFLGANLLYAQEVSIRGTVVDEFGYPLAGAEVLLVDTPLGAQTDIDGIYIISGVAPGSYNLSVRFLGYEPQTLFNIIVKSKGNPEYNFSLSPKAEALEGVVLQADNFICSTQRISAFYENSIGSGARYLSGRKQRCGASSPDTTWCVTFGGWFS